MLRDIKMTNQDIFDKIFKCLHYIISIFIYIHIINHRQENIYIENDYGSTCINALFYEIEIDSQHM